MNVKSPPPSVKPGFAKIDRTEFRPHVLLTFAVHIVSPGLHCGPQRDGSGAPYQIYITPHSSATTPLPNLPFIHAGPIHHFKHDHSAIFLFTKVTADSPAALPQSVYHFFSTNGASVVACVLQDLWRLFGSTDRAEVSCRGKRLTSAKKNGKKPEEEVRLPPPTVLSLSIGFLISGPPGPFRGQPVAPTCSKCTT